MRLGELVKRLDVSCREARYVLERHHADHWVQPTPGSGHHRQLTPGEAFALALLLRLRQSGLRPKDAQRVVELVEEGTRGVARQLGWDPRYRPFDGQFATEFTWLAEVGDMKAFRIVTDANPSAGRKMQELPWITLGKRRRKLEGYEACVTIRVNLNQLADLALG